MSPLWTSRPEAVTLNVRQRTQSALSALNLHWAGVAVLVLLNLYLVVQLALTGQAASHGNAEALAHQQVTLKTAEIAARPLAGLDSKLAMASADADHFTRERLPLNYSEVAAELGALAHRTGTRLTRVQYAQAAVAGDSAGQLTEVRMDASLSGDYRALALFLNGLERDRTFFLISGLTLTGQQTGMVNLRIRVTTYLRGLGSVAEAQSVAVGSAAVAGEGSPQ